MTEQEFAIVRQMVRDIYQEWHVCALRESEMRPADRARGLKSGTLCDDCVAMIDARMSDLRKATGDE